jgi:hypothetical protein
LQDETILDYQVASSNLKIASPTMTRFAAQIAAATIAVATLAASPAVAASYSAKPAAAPAAKRIIGKSISWTCASGTCLGTTEASRPLVLCQDLAKRAGRIDAFLVDGRAIGGAELDKCNGAAKAGAPTATAAN